MDTTMRLSFLRGVLRGLGSPAEIFGGKLEPEQSASATDAMRSDWERIGQDFKKVMVREAPPGKNEESSAPTRQRSAA